MDRSLNGWSHPDIIEQRVANYTRCLDFPTSSDILILDTYCCMVRKAGDPLVRHGPGLLMTGIEYVTSPGSATRVHCVREQM